MAQVQLNPLVVAKNDDDITFTVAPAAAERRVSSRRSSLFGLENRSKNASPPTKTNKSEYEQALLTECKQWDALIQQTLRHNRSLAATPLQLTMHDLTIDHRNYLDARPDFRQFQADSARFAANACRYLQRMEWFEQHKAAIVQQVDAELRQTGICLRRAILE